MSYEKIAKVVDSLIVNTGLGKILWKESTFDENAFQYSTANSSIVIQNIHRDFDNSDVCIDIYDKTGKKVESVTDNELNQFFEMPYVKMKNLYDLARRQALGVEKILDNLLEELPSVSQEQSLLTTTTSMDSVPRDLSFPTTARDMDNVPF